MAATVTLYQQRSALGPDGYQVSNNITASSGIPVELFVYMTGTGDFDHVACMQDFQYPTTQAAAQVPTPNISFYRLSGCSQTFPDVATAIAWATMIKERIKGLLGVFDPAVLNFVGDDTTLFQ